MYSIMQKIEMWEDLYNEYPDWIHVLVDLYISEIILEELFQE